jgi:hypothetical protein
VPPKNQHLVLLGYSDGLFEIRDTETLGKVQLTRSNLTQGVLAIDLIYDQFDDQFGSLCTLTVDGAIDLITEPEPVNIREA